MRDLATVVLWIAFSYLMWMTPNGSYFRYIRDGADRQMRFLRSLRIVVVTAGQLVALWLLLDFAPPGIWRFVLDLMVGSVLLIIFGHLNRRRIAARLDRS